MTKPAPETPVEAPKPKSKVALFAVLGTALGVINLGGTGFVAFKLVELTKPADVEPEEAPVEAPKLPGPVAELPTLVVNLDEPGVPRYLKATVSVQLRDPEVLPALELAKAEIRDQFLRYLSTLRIADTRGEDGKTKIQRELLARVQGRLGTDEVQSVFFGEFVVQ